MARIKTPEDLEKHRKELESALTEHREAISQRRLEEDRRLLYVALTRAKQSLLVSAHHWSETGDKPRGGSAFFDEIRTIIAHAIADPTVDSTGMEIDVDAPEPAADATNPLADEIVSACRIAEDQGAAFVKTSTQTQPEGATVEVVRLMRRTVGPKVGVKASGYITDIDKVLALYDAGARRFGTGYTERILQGLEERLGAA